MTRSFVDNIFAHIGSESLTDNEFESLDPLLPDELTKLTYEALRALLTAREAVSNQLKKLKLYFKSAGAELEGSPEYVPRSQIMIGVPLD